MTLEPGSRSNSNQTTGENSSMQKVLALQEARPGLDVKTDGWDNASVTQVGFIIQCHVNLVHYHAVTGTGSIEHFCVEIGLFLYA